MRIKSEVYGGWKSYDGQKESVEKRLVTLLGGKTKLYVESWKNEEWMI